MSGPVRLRNRLLSLAIVKSLGCGESVLESAPQRSTMYPTRPNDLWAKSLSSRFRGASFNSARKSVMSSAPTIAPSSVPTSSELVSKSKFARLLRARPQYRTPVLVLLALCLPIAVAVVWFIWFKWMPNVWSWAFHPVSWRVIPGAIALFFLASLPLVPFAPIFQGIGATLSLYIDDQTARVTEAVNRGSSQLETVEEELKATDKSGLVPLLL